jgi:hypothetical protein
VSVRAQDDNPSQIDVEISFEVKFVKSTMIKWAIESNTVSEMKKWIDKFFKWQQGLAGDKPPDHVERIAVKEASDDPAPKVEVAKPKPEGLIGGLTASITDSLETWSKVPGRLVFVTCFVMMMIVMTQVYWQGKVTHQRLIQLHTDIDELRGQMTSMQALLETKSKNGKR